MTISELNDAYAIPGVLTFDTKAGMPRLNAKTPACEATLYLQGAHLTHWQPSGTRPVLFLSERAELAPGKAIRGGIPLCFPWFGPRSEGLGQGSGGGQHGFARTSNDWQLSFAALAGEDLHLTFTLAPTDLSRSLGFDNFRVVYELVLGRTLTLRFTVANTGQQPLRFEEALHTYFHVEDVRTTPVKGLESATYLDKTDAGAEKKLPAGLLTLAHWTDWVFPSNPAPVTIQDAGRTLQITKQKSQTTVVWNPWEEKSTGMADLAPGAWPTFLCIESANTGKDAVTLAPQQSHTLEVHVAVKTF